MGATNKTTNYELPQWIGTDKPTFLGDMNDAFLKIDTGMAENKDSATSAESIAGASNAKATEAYSMAQTAQTTASQAQTTASTAQNTADSALGTAQTALEKANQAIAGTANSWQNVSKVDNTAAVNTSYSAGFVAYNAGLNLLNIALYFNATGVGTYQRFYQRTKLCSLGAPIRPNGQRKIVGAGVARGYGWRAVPGDYSSSPQKAYQVEPIVYDITIEADGGLWIQPVNNLSEFAPSDPDGNGKGGFQEVGIQLMLNTSQWGIQ